MLDTPESPPAPGTSSADRPAATPRVAAHLLLTAAASCLSFVLFLAVLAAVHDRSRPISAFDDAILYGMRAHRTPALTTIAHLLADLGNPITIVGVALVSTLIGCFFRPVRGAAWTLPVAVVGAGILIQSVKLAFKRQRPDLFAPLLHEKGYSFPSGHSVISVVVYGLLGYFAMHLFQNKAARVAIGAFTVLLIVAIGVSRVYVEVHFPTDVLAGWALGVPWMVGCLALHEHLARRYGGKLGEPVFPSQSAQT